MPQVLRPDNIPSTFTITGALTAQMVASVSSPIRVTIGGQQYTSTSNLSLNLATTGAGGLDTGSVAVGTYYLYLAVSGSALALVASLLTAPSGFSIHKLIGRVIVAGASTILDVVDETTYQSKIIAAKNNKNYLINGNFEIWQRGIGPTAGNGSGVYLADRWLLYANSGLSTVQRFTGYNDGSGASNSALITFNAGDSDVSLFQPIETLISKQLQGKIVTFSVYLKKSPTFTNDVNIVIRQSNDSDSRFLLTSQTNTSLTVANSRISTSNFTRFSVTTTILPGSSQVGVYVQTDPTVTGSYIEIRQAMLSEDYIVPPFKTAGTNIAEEVQMCLRYYERNGALNRIRNPTNASGAATQFVAFTVFLKVKKRGTPTISFTYDVSDGPQNVSSSPAYLDGDSFLFEVLVPPGGFLDISSYEIFAEL